MTRVANLAAAVVRAVLLDEQRVGRVVGVVTDEDRVADGHALLDHGELDVLVILLDSDAGTLVGRYVRAGEAELERWIDEVLDRVLVPAGAYDLGAMAS